MDGIATRRNGRDRCCRAGEGCVIHHPKRKWKKARSRKLRNQNQRKELENDGESDVWFVNSRFERRADPSWNDCVNF